MKPVEIPAPPPASFDPLAEAEALRLALVEAGQRVARLVAWLKSHKKDQRALTQVWSSLQSLKLRP